jgi:hypothetical protein
MLNRMLNLTYGLTLFRLIFITWGVSLSKRTVSSCCFLALKKTKTENHFSSPYPRSRINFVHKAQIRNGSKAQIRNCILPACNSARPPVIKLNISDRLPGKAAVQGCRARLPGKGACNAYGAIC